MSANAPEPDLVLPHAVCAGCGCLCDDVAIRFRDGKAVEIERACTMGQDWIRSLGTLEPQALVRGKPASLEEAIDAASKLIAAADAPAVIGLCGLSVEALREAVALADAIGAPLIPWPSIPEAILRSGIQAPECTATLGEVRNTADLVLFWRADPDRTHPRHLERYSHEPSLLNGGNRVLIVADADAGNKTVRRASDFLSLPEGGGGSLPFDLSVVRWTRLHLERSEGLEGDLPEQRLAASLCRRIAASRHAHVFLGAPALEPPALWNAFHSLAATVREKHRVTVSALGPAGNARGVIEVLAWRTGRLGAGIGAKELLEKGAADLVISLGLDPGELGPDVRAAYQRQKRIVLSRRGDPNAEVSMSLPGLDPRSPASVIRSDGVCLAMGGGDGAPSRWEDSMGTSIHRTREKLLRSGGGP